VGRLFILPVDDPPPDSKASLMPDLPIPQIASSDAQHVAAHKAEYCDDLRLSGDWREGKYVLSYQTTGGWVAVTQRSSLRYGRRTGLPHLFRSRTDRAEANSSALCARCPRRNALNSRHIVSPHCTSKPAPSHTCATGESLRILPKLLWHRMCPSKKVELKLSLPPKAGRVNSN
jgi:hypothetical protein